MWDFSRPKPMLITLLVVRRNLRVWARILGPAILLNFGEPTLYLLGLG